MDTSEPNAVTNLAQVRLVPGQPLLMLASYDLAELGLGSEEFFVSGSAHAFSAPEDALIVDGRWSVLPDAEAPFETRIVVLRPVRPERFSGTVIVEWLNVSAGMDAAPDWLMSHREIARSGHAYVAVSCQRVGIEGGPSMGQDMSLKTLNGARYASLNHPGDAFAYDIFTQVARLLRSPDASGLLGSLRPQHILAVGESQSAAYLVTYINAVDPIAQAFDGYLVHSRGATVARLSGQSLFVGERLQGVRLRSDLRVPTIVVQTETDLLALGGLAVRQPDSDRLRTWEIAGTAHADNYLLAAGMIDSGNASPEILAAAFEPVDNLMGTQLSRPVNFAAQHHYVTQTALHRLNAWVVAGTAPPVAPPLDTDPADPLQLARDADGIALGGIRTPWCDVPTACSTGVGEPGTMSLLFGSSVRFDPDKLAERYPLGEAQYLTQFASSLEMTIKAGFILSADREEIMGLAKFGFRSALSAARTDR